VHDGNGPIIQTCESSEVHESSAIFLKRLDNLFESSSANDIIKTLSFRTFERSGRRGASSHKVIGFNCVSSRLAERTDNKEWH